MATTTSNSISEKPFWAEVDDRMLRHAPVDFAGSVPVAPLLVSGMVPGAEGTTGGCVKAGDDGAAGTVPGGVTPGAIRGGTTAPDGIDFPEGAPTRFAPAGDDGVPN